MQKRHKLQNMVLLCFSLLALILILIIVYNNAPALKGFRDKHNFAGLVDKILKRKQDPAAIKDDNAKWDVVPTKISMDEILSVDLTPQNYNQTEKVREK